MGDNEKQEFGSVIQQLVKEQLSRRNEQDNSFAFLEKSTLQLLIAYLVSGENSHVDQLENSKSEEKWIKQLDDLLEESREQLEEVVDLLKRYSG
ncbi:MULTISPECIES: hypothetical protein [Lysinibacillus]|uniref:hypothetical protein n=1 Tax=Lysinibacillus TaxID=400634 RepID=UPI00214BEEB8|nr:MULTISPECIES: hypothetical protein [Lysinibacillus]UNT55975.1 hypothetical protein ICJ70_02425 [Lysinibacillus capsici]UUV24207.1 hypothetical protein NP781_20815 [Lysinibacillus sp. FN11]UYB47081.1 hypothetical protein OCI51_23430 [Lysinibacillus capsici]WHP40963.1 hypothetical protein QIX46_20860 [Lysinibacillus boronitolerans]